MIAQRWLYLPLFAAIMGFALGGSFVAGYLFPQTQQQQSPAANKNDPAQRPSIEERHQATEEAIALYNKVLAWFTGILAIATIVLGGATVALYFANERQIALARSEFASSHRPKIRIKHVWLVALGSNQPVTVEIIYANVGDAKAIVSKIGMDFNVINADAQLPPGMTPPERSYIKYPEIGMGVTVSTGNVVSLARLDGMRVLDIRNGEKLLCCFGFIEYSDIGPPETRKIRRTAFCRMYRPSRRPIDGMGRFVRPEQPDFDYEYED